MMLTRILAHLRAAKQGDWFAAAVFTLFFAVCVWLPAIVGAFR